jgi:hypothetical protein
MRFRTNGETCARSQVIAGVFRKDVSGQSDENTAKFRLAKIQNFLQQN